MRGRKPGGMGPVSYVLILFGIMIILALVLPQGFWWLMLAVVLILLGLQLCKRF